jgi:hypothetical protein
MGAEVRKTLILELSSDDVRTRERASRELEERGREADLEALKTGTLSPEARARIEEILATWKRPLALSGEGLRTSRAVQVLEGIGSAEARELLSALARGSRLERERDDAALALSRLSAGKSEKPASR